METTKKQIEAVTKFLSSMQKIGLLQYVGKEDLNRTIAYILLDKSGK